MAYRYSRSRGQELTFEVSSRQVKARWEFPRAHGRSMYRITLINSISGRLICHRETDKNYYELYLTEGKNYKLRVELLDINGTERSVDNIISDEFKAIFSKEELNRQIGLCQKIIDESKIRFLDKPNTTEITHFHRTSFKKDWENARRAGRIETKMQKRTGHPASFLLGNHKIPGVYLATNLDPDGSFPRNSPFGDVRYLFKRKQIFDPRQHNIYFAMLSCFQGQLHLHYVTLLICEKNSWQDSYAADYLVELDPYNNSLLWINNRKCFVTNHIYVNVMFTDDVSFDWGEFDNTRVNYVRGNSFQDPSYYRNCQHCDIHHPHNHWFHLTNLLINCFQ